jgi:type II secretory pathway component GspD/PulD (secretin)
MKARRYLFQKNNGGVGMKITRTIKGATVGSLVFILMLIFELCLSPAYTQEEIRHISMDFQNAALKDVLKVFSQQAGLNFVATENIEDRRITLYLDGVTVQDALDSIMKVNNLAYEQAPGSSIFVVKESGKAKVDMITKVYTLKFARVAKSAGGKESAESQIADIKSILENLLSKGPDGKTLGTVIIDNRTNSLIITSIPTDFALVEDTINRLDTFTPQALIEAEIVEIKTSVLKNLGLEWGGTSTGTFVTFTGPKKQTKFPFIRKHAPFSTAMIKGVTETDTLGILNLVDFALVIKALEREGSAKYLAKPRIMALNNEPAEIKITADTTVGVQRTSVTDTGEVIETAERVETGVTLKVTPTINNEGYITMTLEPEVSRTEQSSFFSNFVDPAKRSAKTTVMVKDGQTIAIGGLLKSFDEGTDRQTPGVSNIPLIGNLFKSKSKTGEQTEIIIFITAHAITDVGDMTSEVARLEKKEEAPEYKEMAATEDYVEATTGVAKNEAAEQVWPAEEQKADLPVPEAEAPVEVQPAEIETVSEEPPLESQTPAIEAIPEEESTITNEEEEMAQKRDEEIKKSVTKLRKKRDVAGDKK